MSAPAHNNQLQSILITGATGIQGGAVIDALLSHPNIQHQFVILALTRDTNSPKAQKLLAKASHKDGLIKLVQGDLSSPEDIFRRAKELSPRNEVWGVFSMQDKDPKSPKRYQDSSEYIQGCSIIDSSLTHNVEFFVYTSGDTGGEAKSWVNPTNVPHFQTKHYIEKYLLDQIQRRGSGMKWSLFRPTIFYENLEPYDFNAKLFMTSYRDTVGRTKALQWISSSDIGIFVSKAFLEPERYYGKALSIASDEFTFTQLNDTFIKVTGKGIPTSNGFFAWAIMKYFANPYYKMVEWFRDEGYQCDMEELKKINPDMMNFETWLKEKSSFPKKG